MTIPVLNLSGRYFNADGSPTAQGQQLLRTVNAILDRAGGIESVGLSLASVTATGGSEDTLDDWMASLVTVIAGLAAHLADTTAAHAASAISYNGATTLSSTDVEGALDELDTEKVPTTRTLTAGLGLSGGGDLSGDRTVAFDPSELTNTATTSLDYLVLGDQSAAEAPIKRAISSFISDQSIALISRTLTAGLGISGGGDLSADRTFAFAPSELTNTALTTSDFFVLGDQSAAEGPIKRDAASVISDLSLMQTSWTLTAGLGISGGGSGAANRTIAFDPSELTETAIASGDKVVYQDISDSNNPKTRAMSSVISDLSLAQTNVSNTWSSPQVFSTGGNNVPAQLDATGSAYLLWKASGSNKFYIGTDGTKWRLLDGSAVELINISLTTGAITIGSSLVETAGKKAVPIPASAMVPNTTNGPSAGTNETTTNKVMYRTFDFDTTTQESAQFLIPMPKGWNESTVTFQACWTAASGSGGVAWDLAGAAFSDDDALDAAFGTAQQVTDTLLAAGDAHWTSESSAITIAGSPAENDLVIFRVRRVPADAADTLGVDAKLIAIRLNITTNASNDA